MRRLFLATLLVLTVTAVIVSAASAASVRKTEEWVYTFTDEPTTRPAEFFSRGVQAAEKFWGIDLPSCPGGRPQFLRYTAAPVAGLPETRALMFADVIGCRVWVDDSILGYYRPSQICTMLVHEIGHLHGLQHSDRGIMRPELGRTLRMCYKHPGRFEHFA